MSRLQRSHRRFTALVMLTFFLPACAQVRVVATKREEARPDVEVRRRLEGSERFSVAGRVEDDALVIRTSRREGCVVDTFREVAVVTEHRNVATGVADALGKTGIGLALSALYGIIGATSDRADDRVGYFIASGGLGSIGTLLAVHAGYTVLRSKGTPPPPPPPVVKRDEGPSRSRTVDCGEGASGDRRVKVRLSGAEGDLSVTTDATGTGRVEAAALLGLWLRSVSTPPPSVVELSVGDGAGGEDRAEVALPDDYAQRHRQTRHEALAATVRSWLDETEVLLARDPPDLEAAQARLDAAREANRAAGPNPASSPDGDEPAKERLAEVAARLQRMRDEGTLARVATMLDQARGQTADEARLEEAGAGLAAARTLLGTVTGDLEAPRERREIVERDLGEAERRLAAARAARDERDPGKGDSCEPAGDCEALCAARQLGACLRWAQYLHEEAHQAARAYTLFDKACRLGSGFACHYLATMTVRGEGVRANRRKGIELDRKGCELGDTDACRDANGLVCADMVRRGPRRPDVDPYCNPSWGRPALPWEPMPLKSHQMGYGGEVMESQSDGACFDLLLQEGCRLTRVARLGYVVAWCCPADLP